MMLRKLLMIAVPALALFGISPAANAMPPGSIGDRADPDLTLVYGGCGPMGHRGPYGGCRAGGQWGGYWRGRPCPRGFHLGAGGRRCWPNRYY